MSLPLRPRFSWDIKSVPWTDGRGDQREFADAVYKWRAFYRNLPETNSNKIDDANQGIVLQSHLYGRARDVCKAISDDVVSSKDGVDAIVNAVYKKDPLSVVSMVYAELMRLLSTKRNVSESFRNFESRFSAQLSRFNALASHTAISDAMAALMLLANSNVDAGQRVAILAAAASSIHNHDTKDSIDYMLEMVQYDSVATVMRQCDEQTMSRNDPIQANTAAFNPQHRSYPPRFNERRNKVWRDNIHYAKRTNACNKCGKYGHWYKDHLQDGSLPDGMPSENDPISDKPTHTREKPTERDRTDTKTPSTITFNNAGTVIKGADLDDGIFRGPLVDSGAPYSAIGAVELSMLSSLVLPKWNGQLDEKPESLDNSEYWQYGTGEHASPPRKILGSIVLPCRSSCNTNTRIRHLVLDGSSQWVVGQNVTGNGNICQTGEPALIVPYNTNANLNFLLVKVNRLLYMPFSYFYRSTSHAAFSSTLSTNLSPNIGPWSKIKPIIDRVHKHLCGHADFTDIKLLLQRNHIWNDDAKQYLTETINKCNGCHAAVYPQTSRKVSLKSINRSFNDCVCVDHLFIDDMRILHVMDAKTRLSAGAVCDDVSIASSIYALNICWLTPYWTPNAVRGDDAFNHKEFTDFLTSIGCTFEPIPPRRHQKNVLESKHAIIRSIYIKLKEAEPKLSNAVLIAKAIDASNQLYGSDIMSAYEESHGFTKPITQNIVPVHDDIVDAHQRLEAKRKLTRILRSRSPDNKTIQNGDLVEIYIKKPNQKRGSWTAPRVVIDANLENGTVTVPGAQNRTVKAAPEDVRLALDDDDSFAKLVRDANDELHQNIEWLLQKNDFESPELPIDSTDSPILERCFGSDDPTDVRTPTPTTAETPNSIDAPKEDENVIDAAADVSNADGDANGEPDVGDNVEIYWPIDNAYYPGVIAEEQDNHKTVVYDDGGIETLDFTNETWRYASSATICATSALSLTLCSESNQVLDAMFDHFGNKPFLRHQAQGFPQFILKNAYDVEEKDFKLTTKTVPLCKIPESANNISSHVIYKVKVNDDLKKKLKARKAPHGNEDCIKDLLRTDCSMCPPTGFRVVTSIAALRKWRLTKIDVKTAFLQTGRAERDVYVTPPRESNDHKRRMWLLLTAAYGLVNANAKWQNLSDQVHVEIGFKSVVYVPQLFILEDYSGTTSLLAKIVDDFLVCGISHVVDGMITELQKHFELGTITHGPGLLRFFGLNITQYDDYRVSIDGDDKLNALAAHPLTRVRRRELDARLNAHESKAYSSINGAVGWLGITASPFCALFASMFQQLAPSATVAELCRQAVRLRELKSLGTTISYNLPIEHISYSLSIVMCSDAGRSAESGQLCYNGGLLVGPLESKSLFHVVSWSSHRARRPVKSIGAAEILAAGEAIDAGKTLAKTYERILNLSIALVIVVDSKDLYSTLTSQRQSLDKSIRGDVGVIRYEFETQALSRFV